MGPGLLAAHPLHGSMLIYSKAAPQLLGLKAQPYLHGPMPSAQQDKAMLVTCQPRFHLSGRLGMAIGGGELQICRLRQNAISSLTLAYVKTQRGRYLILQHVHVTHCHHDGYDGHDGLGHQMASKLAVIMGEA